MANRVRGVGLQFNPTIIDDLGLDTFADAPCAFAEVLCDCFAAPLDCGYVIDPALRPLLERIGERYPLLAHSNYGEEFGFADLAETCSVRRHIPLAREIGSPWLADHMFYGCTASSYMWSTPLQFSRRELERLASRAAALQDRLQAPLLHENAFYYSTFPGTDMAEAEFMAGLVERAGTYLLLDLHNVYTNSVDHAGYDAARFLRTIPLDRVIEVHLAGGQWIGEWYHDLHNSPVPQPVWEMLEHVLRHARNLQAVTLEVQGPSHTAGSRTVDASWPAMIKADLARAQRLWDSVHGAQPGA